MKKNFSNFKKIFLAIIIFIIAVFLHNFFGFLGIFIFILYLILAIIILCRGKKTYISSINTFIRNHYFSASFKTARIINNNSKKGVNLIRQIKLFFYNFYFRVFYYAVLIFNNSKQSFKILREELQKKHKKSISIKTIKNGQEQIVDIEYLVEKIKKGEIQESDKELINHLMDRLYQLHSQSRKKITIFSFTAIIIIIIATALSNLLLSLILPIILKTK